MYFDHSTIQSNCKVLLLFGNQNKWLVAYANKKNIGKFYLAFSFFCVGVLACMSSKWKTLVNSLLQDIVREV